ncbi:hypothetical protein HYV80_07080 [Candidatus Woesearchaeota archaeon]|nr:hypothetical protein [Candidatus Woesearchaeota archaeon]
MNSQDNIIVMKPDIKEEIAKKRGFVPISKEDPLWRNMYKSIDFIVECSSPAPKSPKQGVLPGFEDNGYLGFADNTPADKPSIISTYEALASLWWAEQGLHIDDAVSRLLDRRGDDAFIKIARFTAKCFGRGSSGEYLAFKPTPSGLELDVESTHRGVEILYLLADAFGEQRAFPEFQRIVGDNGFLEVYKFIKACFSKERGPVAEFFGIEPNFGAYRPLPNQGKLNIHSTYGALETLKFIAPYIGEQGKSLVGEVKENTILIRNFIRLFRNRFGFLPGSEQNVLSTHEAMEISEILFWFNHPDKIRDKEALREFEKQFYDPKKLVDFVMRCYNPTTGGFAGYALR